MLAARVGETAMFFSERFSNFYGVFYVIFLDSYLTHTDISDEKIRIIFMSLLTFI